MNLDLIFAGIRSFGRLSSAKRVLAIETVLVLLLVWVLTRFVPARFWLQTCTAEEPTSDGRKLVKTRTNNPMLNHKPMTKTDDQLNKNKVVSSDLDIGRMIGRAVEKTAHYLPLHMRCLHKAIAAQWMLDRRGVGSVLRFGVRRDTTMYSRFEYHAWLIVDKEPVIGGNEVESYSAFPPFSSLRTNKKRT